MTVYISRDKSNAELAHYGVKGMKWRKHLKAKSKGPIVDFIDTYKKHNMNWGGTIYEYSKRVYDRYLKKPLHSAGRRSKEIGEDVYHTLFDQLEGPWKKK